MSTPTHYDGSQARLDEEVASPPNACMIVTILEDADAEREEAAAGLEAAYGDDVGEYTAANIRR